MAADPINPSHYKQGVIECIEALESIGIGPDFCRGNAIKYLWRCGLKGEPLKDAKKAQWYVNRLVQELENEIAENAARDGSTDAPVDVPAVPPSLPATNGHQPPRVHGVVKKLNLDKGYGFISQGAGAPDRFFHASSVTDGGFEFLKEGQEVTFDMARVDRGDVAVAVTAV